MTDTAPASASSTTPGYLVKVALLCAAFVGAFVTGDILTKEAGALLVREGGGIETATAILYGIGIVVFFVTVPKTFWSGLFHIPGLMAIFAMRELDFDKEFTQAGILSLRFYSGDSPLMTKLIGGAIALAAAYIILRNIYRGMPAALRAVREGEVWPWFAVIAAVTVVFVKTMDGLGRKLGGIGITISEELDMASYVSEEVAEAFIPILFILAVLARWKGRAT